MDILMDYDFPGNIRELENIIEHSFVLCREAYIRREHLPRTLRRDDIPLNTRMTLAEVERTYILRALEKNAGNRSKTASELGIDASTLWRKLKRFGIAYPE
jgi:transcriptional regulator of acetoin/glycerol metabolism